MNCCERISLRSTLLKTMAVVLAFAAGSAARARRAGAAHDRRHAQARAGRSSRMAKRSSSQRMRHPTWSRLCASN